MAYHSHNGEITDKSCPKMKTLKGISLDTLPLSQVKSTQY